MTPENEILTTGAVRQKTAGRGCYELMSPFVLERDAKLYEWGKENRGNRNWEKGMPFSRCIQSMYRHLGQFLMRTNDQDHGDCLAAIRFWAGALMHFEEMIKRGVLPTSLDDLPRYDTPSKGERIYVAGPISADTEEEMELNYKRGQELGIRLQNLGHLVFVPHNYVVKIPGLVGRVSDKIYEELLQLDFSVIRHWATAMFFMAPSPGANRELELAQELGLKVFFLESVVPDLRTR
jgi:hypothetical protein